METDPPPPLKWSSRERSVPEVSMLNDSSLKCQSNNLGYLPAFDPLIRKDFPLSSSPPLKASHAFNGSPLYVPPTRPQWTPEVTKAPNIDSFKTDLLSAILSQNSNQLDLFKSEILNIVRNEHKAEIDEVKKGISLIKSELCNILPNLKSELFSMLEKMKIETQSKSVKKKEVGIQIGFEKQDQSIQTDDVHFKAENVNCQNIQDENEIFQRQAHKKTHEGFELRLVNDYEKLTSNDNNVRYSKEVDSDNSESDEVDDRLSPVKRPMKRFAPKHTTDCDMVQVDDFYNIQGPNQRGGFARVQELRMTGANRNQHCPLPTELPPCNDISMATNAVLAKYLPPEKVAECQTPRRQNPTPTAQDVVFNMTNVSFAMRYPNDSPNVGNYNYPPQNRHLKPSRLPDRYEHEDYWRHPRRIIEQDEWQTKQTRDILRQHPVPDRDRFHHGMAKENGMEPGYQEEYNYGRRDGFVRENKWGRGVPFRENWNGPREEPDWANPNNYPIHGRGQPPINNRILDVTAIKNQPKLT